MSSLFPFEFDPRTSSNVFWIWGAGTLLLATGLGFLAGAIYANRSADRGVRKAVKSVPSLYALAIQSLDKSRHLTGLLENFPAQGLNAHEIEELDSKHRSLVETIARLIGRHREACARQPEPAPKPKSKSKAEPIRLSWQRTSLDPLTNLPDRSMFEANLRAMLLAGAKSDLPSGLLLVTIDRREQFKERFGIRGADELEKGLTAVLSRAVREQDLVCRLVEGSFGILCPSVETEVGRKLAQSVRNSVRCHTFRIDGTGAEVLVTASFGYATCSSDDNAESALARSRDALEQSMRRGRNELHVSEGASLIHCALAG